MDWVNEINYFTHLLRGKYRVSTEVARDCVYQAFSEIYGREHENFKGLWYLASRNKVVDYIRIKSKETPLESWHLHDTAEQDEFEGVQDRLRDNLHLEEWKLFKRLKKGQSAKVISEQTGMSEGIVKKKKQYLIRRCREILFVADNGWLSITSDKPKTKKDVELKLSDKSTILAYRIKGNRWIDENNRILNKNPIKWRPLLDI